MFIKFTKTNTSKCTQMNNNLEKLISYSCLSKNTCKYGSFLNMMFTCTLWYKFWDQYTKHLS